MPKHTITSELEALLAAIQGGTYIGPGAETLTAGRLLPVAFQQHTVLPDVLGFAPGQMVVVPEDGLYVAVGELGTNDHADFTSLDPTTSGPSTVTFAGYGLDFETTGGLIAPDIDSDGLTPNAGGYGVFRGIWHLPAIAGKVAVVVHGRTDGTTDGNLNVGWTGMRDGNLGAYNAQVQSGGARLEFTNENGGTYQASQGSGATSTPPYGQPQALSIDLPVLNGGSGGPFTFTLLVDPDNYLLTATYSGIFGDMGPLSLRKNHPYGVGGGVNGGNTAGGDLQIQLDGGHGHQHISSVTVQAAGSLRWNKTALAAA